MTVPCTSSKPPHANSQATTPFHIFKYDHCHPEALPESPGRFSAGTSSLSKCTPAILKYLILIFSLEGCQGKHLHKLSTGREAVQPYSRHPLDVSSGTQGLTSLPAVSDGAMGPHQGAISLPTAPSLFLEQCLLSLELEKEGALLHSECFNTSEQAGTRKEAQGQPAD